MFILLQATKEIRHRGIQGFKFFVDGEQFIGLSPANFVLFLAHCMERVAGVPNFKSFQGV